MDQDLQFRQRPETTRPRTNRGLIPVAILAFCAGAGLVGALAWNGRLGAILPSASLAAPMAASAPAPGSGPVTALETRLAMLEDRFSRLDLQANAAAGNAGRAEALLIAQATRRVIDRGQPLGYLGDQLRLRFADAQPGAVGTLVGFAQAPITLATLDARLDALAPQLAEPPRSATTWQRVRSSLANLFTIRRDATPSVGPEARIARARLLLAGGNVEQAAADVARLPGADDARDWIADARRYGAAQQALDVIESAAMADPARAAPPAADAAAGQALPTPQTDPAPQPSAEPAPAA